MTDAHPRFLDRRPDGRFIAGHPKLGGRPKGWSERWLQRALAASARLPGEADLMLMLSILSGPACGHCGKPLALTSWRARRAFCSAACANADVHRRRAGARRRNARSKLARGIRPGPSESSALDGQAP